MNLEKDQKYANLIEKLKQKKEELRKSKQYVYATNCLFTYGTEKPTNLHTVNSVQKVKDMMGKIEFDKFINTKANQALGIEEEEYLFLGYSYDAWVSDLKHILNKIQTKATVNQLNQYINQLNERLSKDYLDEVKFNEINKFFDNL